jgi:hypothetical protein
MSSYFSSNGTSTQGTTVFVAYLTRTGFARKSPGDVPASRADRRSRDSARDGISDRSLNEQKDHAPRLNTRSDPPRDSPEEMLSTSSPESAIEVDSPIETRASA